MQANSPLLTLVVTKSVAVMRDQGLGYLHNLCCMQQLHVAPVMVLHLRWECCCSIFAACCQTPYNAQMAHLGSITDQCHVCMPAETKNPPHMLHFRLQ